MNKNDHQKSRRDFLKKAAYTAPVILTLKAVPAFATYGSYNMQGSHRMRTGGSHKLTAGSYKLKSGKMDR